MRWIIRIVGTLVVLVVVAVGAFLLVPAERIAGLAADRFKAATGRTLTIEGPVRATLWPRTGVRVQDVTVANPDWAGSAPLLQAGSVEVGVPLSVLFGGEVRIERLEVREAVLTLVRDAGGAESWDLIGGGGNGAGDGGDDAPSGPLPIEYALLNGAEINFQDRGSGSDWQLRAVDLEARLPDPAGELDVSGSALIGGQAVSLDAQVDRMDDLLAGTLAPVTAEVASGGTRLSLEGRVDLDPAAFEGRASAVSSDRFALLQAFGVAPPDLPAGLGSESVDVTAAVTLAPAGTIHLRDIVADLDGNRLSGAIDVDPTGERPMVTANLAAESLDLTSISRKGQGGETALVSETGWGREEIDVSGLFVADADVTLSTGPIILGDATLDEVRAKIALDRGRAVITLQPLVAYGGLVTGDVVVNGRGGLSARATLDLVGLQMQPLLTEFADWDRLLGQADATLRLLGVGNTAQALVESLEGSLSLTLGPGQIEGLDLAGMIRTLDLSHRGEGAATVFDGATATLDVVDGVGTGEMSLEAPLLTSTGSGTVDLGAQTLDWRLVPTLRNPEVTVPVVIRGPWDDPDIRPDLEWLGRQRLEEERRALESRAREEAEALRARAEDELRQQADRLRDRVAEELDVAPEVLDERPVEDVIRERVENELIDLLLGR